VDVLLDNMTLAGARRMTDYRGEGLFKLYHPTEVQIARSEKCDFQRVNAIRLACDLVSLAHHLHWAVFADRVRFDLPTAAAWRGGPQLPGIKAADAPPSDAFMKVLYPFSNVSPERRREVLDAAAAVVLGGTGPIENAIGCVQESDNFARALLELTDGYFETGFADPQIVGTAAATFEVADEVYRRMEMIVDRYDQQISEANAASPSEAEIATARSHLATWQQETWSLEFPQHAPREVVDAGSVVMAYRNAKAEELRLLKLKE